MAGMEAAGAALSAFGASLFPNLMAAKQMGDEEKWREFYGKLEQKKFALSQQEADAARTMQKKQMDLMESAEARAVGQETRAEAEAKRAALDWERAALNQQAFDEEAKKRGYANAQAWEAANKGKEADIQLANYQLAQDELISRAGESELRIKQLNGQLTQQEIERRTMELEAARQGGASVGDVKSILDGTAPPEKVAAYVQGMRANALADKLEQSAETMPLSIEIRNNPTIVGTPEFQSRIAKVAQSGQLGNQLDVMKMIIDATTVDPLTDKAAVSDPGILQSLNQLGTDAGLPMGEISAVAPPPETVYRGREQAAADKAQMKKVAYVMPDGKVKLGERKAIPATAKELTGEIAKRAFSALSTGKYEVADYSALADEADMLNHNATIAGPGYGLGAAFQPRPQPFKRTTPSLAELFK